MKSHFAHRSSENGVRSGLPDDRGASLVRAGGIKRLHPPGKHKALDPGACRLWVRGVDPPTTGAIRENPTARWMSFRRECRFDRGARYKGWGQPRSERKTSSPTPHPSSRRPKQGERNGYPGAHLLKRLRAGIELVCGRHPGPLLVLLELLHPKTDAPFETPGCFL